MRFAKFISATVLGFAFSAFALPAEARLAIASGEVELNTSVEGCLARAERVIQEIDVPMTQGDYSRSGYFRDGAFRILCYSTGARSSLAVMFVAHDTSQSVADSFLQELFDRF